MKTVIYVSRHILTFDPFVEKASLLQRLVMFNDARRAAGRASRDLVSPVNYSCLNDLALKVAYDCLPSLCIYQHLPR